MNTEHISDDDLERYYLGMITEEELAPIEEHLLWCHSCQDRLEETQDYVDLIRQVLNKYRLHAFIAAKLVISFVLVFYTPSAFAQNDLGPTRWQAQYTQIYFDSVSTVARVLGSGFSLGVGGSLTSDPSEVVSGKESIKGSDIGTGAYTTYLQTNPTIIPLTPNHSYRVTFQFYGYSVHDEASAPYWMDEYSVDDTGTAVMDRSRKGYLGQALGDAVELADPGTAVLQEDFESGSLSSAFLAGPPSAVSITQDPNDVISGGSSLVLSNPDHTQMGYVSVSTNPAKVPFAAGNTCLLVFDWRVLETIDARWGLTTSVTLNGQNWDSVNTGQPVASDSGTVLFPFTVSSDGNWSVRISIGSGGGKVAIDNLRIYQGGVGPWCRDFENGFVVVNPLLQPQKFSAADLAGSLNRTGIRRIKGTQAPDVNNGRPVDGDFTLDPFDAIILLADHIDAPDSTAAGGPPKP